MMDPHAPTFAMLGSEVDSYLRALPGVWVACDEFAAGCAAIAFHMVTGTVATLVALEGPGTNMALPALAIAAEEGIPVNVHTATGWAPPTLPAPTLMDVALRGEPLRLARFADRDRFDALRLGEEQIVTQGSAIPGARFFGRQWLGYWGFMCDPTVRAAVAARPVLDSDGPTIMRAPSSFVARQAPAWVDAAVEALDRALPEDAAVVCDAGSSHEAVVRLVAKRGLRPVVQPLQQVIMGWSLGAALGIHAGMPNLPVGVVIGDGSLLGRVGDLAVLARYRVPAVIVVIVNGLLGEGRRAWSGQPGADLAVLPTVDWQAVVTAVGATVANDLANAVDAVSEGPQVVLVEEPKP